jgi:hypothetical protein
MIDSHTATLEEIRYASLHALTRELGTTGMARVLQQFNNGYGDYTAERQQWVGTIGVKALIEQVQRSKEAK